jgi:hypothetical protein
VTTIWNEIYSSREIAEGRNLGFASKYRERILEPGAAATGEERIPTFGDAETWEGAERQVLELPYQKVWTNALYHHIFGDKHSDSSLSKMREVPTCDSFFDFACEMLDLEPVPGTKFPERAPLRTYK